MAIGIKWVCTNVGQVCGSWPSINQGINIGIICLDQRAMVNKKSSYTLPRWALLLLYTCNAVTYVGMCFEKFTKCHGGQVSFIMNMCRA